MAETGILQLAASGQGERESATLEGRCKPTLTNVASQRLHDVPLTVARGQSEGDKDA